MLFNSPLSQDSRNIDVRESRVGKGLFARRAFQAGEYVFTIWGQCCSLPDPLHRHFLDPSTEKVVVQVGPRVWIDPGLGFGRWLNHSCLPNVAITTEGYLPSGLAGAQIVSALVDIAPDQEVTADYASFELFDCLFGCQCGFPICRGWLRTGRKRTKIPLGGYFSLSRQERKFYSEHGIFAPWLQRLHQSGIISTIFTSWTEERCPR